MAVGKTVVIVVLYCWIVPHQKSMHALGDSVTGHADTPSSEGRDNYTKIYRYNCETMSTVQLCNTEGVSAHV